MFAKHRNVKLPWRCTHGWQCLKNPANKTLVQPLNSTPLNSAALRRNKSLFYVRSSGRTLGWTYSLLIICRVPQRMDLRQGNCNYFQGNLILCPTWWTSIRGNPVHFDNKLRRERQLSSYCEFMFEEVFQVDFCGFLGNAGKITSQLCANINYGVGWKSGHWLQTSNSCFHWNFR